MKKLNFNSAIVLIITLAISFGDVPAQTRKKRKTVRKKPVAVGTSQQAKNPPMQCKSLTMGNGKMTYLVGAGKLSTARSVCT